MPCGECAACREEKTNCCERVSLYGVHQDGVLVSTLRYVKTTLCLSLTRSATVPEHWLNVSPLVHMPFVGQRSRLNKTYW
ncbi:alcohol dehydrogenase catalytic domain-containing protein [Escherichia coli]|nr:alcohol dehydrogenase catalytic domain-containing protein [Escherichia coli]